MSKLPLACCKLMANYSALAPVSVGSGAGGGGFCISTSLCQREEVESQALHDR